MRGEGCIERGCARVENRRVRAAKVANVIWKANQRRASTAQLARRSLKVDNNLICNLRDVVNAPLATFRFSLLTRRFTFPQAVTAVVPINVLSSSENYTLFRLSFRPFLSQMRKTAGEHAFHSPSTHRLISTVFLLIIDISHYGDIAINMTRLSEAPISYVHIIPRRLTNQLKIRGNESERFSVQLPP